MDEREKQKWVVNKIIAKKILTCLMNLFKKLCNAKGSKKTKILMIGNNRMRSTIVMLFCKHCYGR